MLTIVFRVDASIIIGSGHLMRCLTLANALQARGASIHFISRNLPENYQAIIKKHNFDLHLLASADSTSPNKNTIVHANWLGVDLNTDARETIEILKALMPISLLVVDHYAIDQHWEKQLRPYVQKILVIDDLADRQHICDILLDQNYYHQYDKRYQSLVPNYTKTLLGPHFVLLRPEFLKARQQFPRSERPLQPVKRINICFGGVDANGHSLKILQVLKEISTKNDLEIDVVVANTCPQIEKIREWIKAYPDISLHISPSNIAELLAQADLGIGAAGTMMWERACVGLPSISLAIASNQRQLAEDAARNGLHFYVGDAEQVEVSHLQSAIYLLLNNPFLRQHFADNCLNMVDGQGVRRVVRHILQPELSLRPATIEDCNDLFAWRNHEVNRRYSHNDEEITYETHQAWFNKILQSTNRHLLIAQDKKGPVGVLRFDLCDDHWLTSIYLVPNRHGEGLGTALLKSGLDWLSKHCQQQTKVHAEIHFENTPSNIAFERAGFKKHFSTFITEINYENRPS